MITVGHDHVNGHGHPSLPCRMSSFALENGFRLGAPRRRCACRGITEPAAGLPTLATAR
jgi:hypothetical protein